LNDKILHKYGRKHTFNTICKAIALLQKNNLFNINLDFIYGFNELTNNDILDEIKFIKKNDIKHVSFYALELKDNSAITKKNYQINNELIENQLKFIINGMKKIG
jgi:oxygen-independent coproporphyrinogen-3 oxidase